MSYYGQYPAPQEHPTVPAPNFAIEYPQNDPWVIKARKQETWADYPRVAQLKEYYTANDKLDHNPWLAPWVFPDGAACFFCGSQGNRGDINMAHLPCRGCQSNKYYKPSKNAAPQCTECMGQGIWKEKFCVKCGGKGLGSFYLPFACAKGSCGARARTNWEMELHNAAFHTGKPKNPEHSAQVTSPFLVPVGKKWNYNVARDGPITQRGGPPRGGY
eukprot:NODE_5767_length_911_cov_191.161168_g5542_i0.p1 GENE.NODE_5767_length_911_cov_191.161168_g5542_i0~~NODE_5767_length_911_cov_191.161168_g5542_i0.p1  ORF type:complete len:216 (+),score=50.89 NODE_5767_length_911_cov_191.161168_g5542_i0:60-707(+)